MPLSPFKHKLGLDWGFTHCSGSGLSANNFTQIFTRIFFWFFPHTKRIKFWGFVAHYSLKFRLNFFFGFLNQFAARTPLPAFNWAFSCFACSWLLGQFWFTRFRTANPASSSRFLSLKNFFPVSDRTENYFFPFHLFCVWLRSRFLLGEWWVSYWCWSDCRPIDTCVELNSNVCIWCWGGGGPFRLTSGILRLTGEGIDISE